MNLDLKLCRNLSEQDRDFALVSLLSRNGSAPRGPGAKMLVLPEGISGTIGGGALEAKAVELALKSLETRTSFVETIDLTGREIDSVDMACGGKVSILVEYADCTDPEVKNHFRRLDSYQSRSVASTCITAFEITEAGTEVYRAVVGGDGIIKGELPGWAQSLPAIDPGEPYRMHGLGDGRRILTESVCPPLHLYIFGGGHVGLKTAELAAFWGQSVTVIDDRAEFVTPERFPNAETVECPEYENAFANFAVDESSCIVIVTRGHRYDNVVLRQALATRAGYIGMIGSKGKIKQGFEQLLAEGWTQADLDRVHAPIGLKIGSETPAEIAISIIAEILQNSRKK